MNTRPAEPTTGVIGSHELVKQSAFAGPVDGAGTVAVASAGAARAGRWKLAGAAALAALALAGCDLPFIGGGDAGVIPFSDTFTLKDVNSERRIGASGTLAAARTTTLVSNLTGPVQSINVIVGDRVTEGQLLASIDVSNEREDLRAQEAQLAQSQQQRARAVQRAQEDLAIFQSERAQGGDGSARAAERGLEQATRNYQRAEEKFQDLAMKDRLNGSEALRQAQGIRQARDAVTDAALGAARAGISDMRVPVEDIDPTNQMTQWQALHTALENLQIAQAEGQEQIRARSRELADAQDAVADAFAAKTDAVFAVEQARRAADTQELQLTRALSDAMVDAGATAEGDALNLNKLRMNIAGAEVRAPMNGVVVGIQAVAGKPASQGLVTLADDSSLVIRTTIRESEIGKVKVGQKVVFTTGATGDKKYTGRVSFVSPVASGAAKEDNPDSMGGGQSGGAAFPVDIEVTGDREGLRIGASTRARIVIEEARSGNVVPLSAIYEASTAEGAEGDGGKKSKGDSAFGVPSPSIFWLYQGDESGESELRACAVEKGEVIGTNIAVNFGEGCDIQDFTLIIADPNRYVHLVGKQVTQD